MFSKNSNPTLSTNYNQPIKLKNISKKYQLGNSQTIWAIKNVNLKINKGSRIGIFGPNGSGKTTLLRIISKITQPTSGQLSIKGKIISLMDLTAGFLPDLTGKENIFINAQLTGMTRKQVKNNYQKIVSLSESKKFINYPFYTYSAGMKFRAACPTTFPIPGLLTGMIWAKAMPAGADIPRNGRRSFLILINSPVRK